MKMILFSLIILMIFNTQLAICQSLQDQEPRGIHLVYGQNPTSEMNIFWWTRVKTTSAIVYYSLVDTETEYLSLELGSCSHNQSMKGYLARNQTSGKYIQRVLLKNLVPNRLYCYEIKSGDTTSNIYSFRTAGTSIEYHKVDYKTNFDTNFIIYGGENTMNTATDSPTIRNVILPQSFQDNIHNKFKASHLYAFINMGDVYLKEYSLTSDNDEKDFFESSSEIFTRLPILPTFGSIYDVKNVKLFRSMFTFMNEWPLQSFWYSFELNGVHFISFSTDLFLMAENINNENNSDTTLNDLSQKIDSQMKWLKADLEKANDNRLSVPWIVVLARQPMYCATDCPLYCNSEDTHHCIQKDELVRNKVESLFYHYGVDLVLQSSEKIYTRSYPVIKNGNYFEASYNNIDMPVHIAVPRTISTDRSSTLVDKNWFAFTYNSESNFNYGQLTAVNSTHLKWSYMFLNNTLIDSVTIVKDYHGMLNSESFMEKTLIQNESRRHRTIKVISILSTCLVVISIIVIYALVKRHQDRQRLKHAAQYANLIESELDLEA